MEISHANRLFSSLCSDSKRAFEIGYWDGSRHTVGNGPVAARVIFRSKKALDALFSDPSMGFGEGYVSGEIEVEGDLGALLCEAFSKDLFSSLTLGDRVRLCWLKFRGRHSVSQCKRDVQAHYDKGNAFYSLWLDKEMNYSCAYFQDPEEPLEKAQERKNRHILRKVRLRPGERLLDIGCGWGALLSMAADEFGAEAVGLTLSEEQHRLASQRLAEKGLASRAQVRLQDYREVPSDEEGSYDKLVSVGMFEHVGKENLTTFFKQAHALLKEGGLFLLHTISRLRPRDTDPWICTYIFPGGYIPSIGETLEAASEAGFDLVDIEDLKYHYAITLSHWLQRFEGVRERVEEMMGPEFVRMWRLYLASSRTSFQCGDLHVSQFLFSKGRVDDLPLTRDWMHCKELEPPI